MEINKRLLRGRHRCRCQCQCRCRHLCWNCNTRVRCDQNYCGTKCYQEEIKNRTRMQAAERMIRQILR